MYFQGGTLRFGWSVEQDDEKRINDKPHDARNNRIGNVSRTVSQYEVDPRDSDSRQEQQLQSCRSTCPRHSVSARSVCALNVAHGITRKAILSP